MEYRGEGIPTAKTKIGSYPVLMWSIVVAFTLGLFASSMIETQSLLRSESNNVCFKKKSGERDWPEDCGTSKAWRMLQAVAVILATELR